VYIPPTPDKVEALRREGGFPTLKAWAIFVALALIAVGLYLILKGDWTEGLLVSGLLIVPLGAFLALSLSSHRQKGQKKEQVRAHAED
jgi:hypothetical protein